MEEKNETFLMVGIIFTIVIPIFAIKFYPQWTIDWKELGLIIALIDILCFIAHKKIN